MVYFIRGNNKSENYSLIKNFLFRLDGRFLGEDATKSQWQSHTISLWPGEKEEFTIQPTNEDYDRLNTMYVKAIHQKAIQEPIHFLLIFDLIEENIEIRLNEELRKISSFNEPCSVHIVGTKSDLLPNGVNNQEIILRETAQKFNEENPTSEVNVQGIHSVSAKTGNGIDSFKQTLLIEILFDKIKLFQQGQSNVDGLQKMVTIINNKKITPEDRLNEVINLAKNKKSDGDYTSFFHNKVRDRKPEVEGFYQQLALLKIENDLFPVQGNVMLKIDELINDNVTRVGSNLK